MTIGMYKVMFHHHFEKSTCPNHSNGLVKFVGMINVKSDGKAFREGFHKDLIVRLRIRNGELDIRVLKYLVELLEVFCFECQVDLIDENFLQGFVLDRDLKVGRYFRKYPTEKEQDINVPFYVLFHVRMPYL